MYRFIWKIKLNDPNDEDKFINHWKESTSILQQYQGAMGTHIHRVRNEPGSFFFIAEWESQDARDAMDNDLKLGTSERAKLWNTLPLNESFGEVITFAGDEFGAVFPEK